jgi:hypothetical protein
MADEPVVAKIDNRSAAVADQEEPPIGSPLGAVVLGKGNGNFDKDRFDAHMQLADFARAIREARRQYEFKMSAIAYAALAALSVYPPKVPVYVILIAVITIWTIHTLWVYRNFRSAEDGRVRMYKHTAAAENMLTGASESPQRMRFFQAWPSILQLPTSYALGIFAVLAHLFSS